MLNETQIILDRLAAADREHQKEAGGRLLLRSVKYVCAAVLTLFVLDVVFHLVAGWRMGLSLSLLSGLLALAVLGWHIAFVRRNRAEHIARFLETRDPALGSRLINLLQLDKQSTDASRAPLTRDLARRAVEGYSADLRGVPIEKLAWTDELRRHLKPAAWTFIGFVALLAVCYRVTSVEVARFADPFGDHPPFSFTQLEIVEPGATGTNVIYGKGLIVRAKALGHQPGELFLTSFPVGHPEQSATVPMFSETGGQFSQMLDSIRSQLTVYVHTKDHGSESGQVRIGVLLTPQLEMTYVRIAPPAYTMLSPEEKAYDFKGVQALEGSEVQFRLQSNRPLREGVLEITAGDHPPQRLALKKSADNEVTGSFIASESGRLRLGIIDVDGLPSQGDFESGLTVIHDLPPDVHITNPEHDAFAAMDFKLKAEIEANDDYGLSEIRFHRGLNGVYSAPQVTKYDKALLDTRETADFDFSDLGIRPGDVISFFAEAVDNAPQPHLARSQTVKLQVISVDDYNNYLREQSDISDTEAKYAQLNNDLQDLIDKQKDLGGEAQKLSDQIAAATPAQREDLARQLDGLVAQQSELNQKLDQQAARMENFVRQHPLYDVEQDMQDILRRQAANIRASTKADDDAVRDIAQQSSPASGPRQLSPDMLQAFKKASDAQVAQLGQTHEDTDKQVVQTLDDMSQMQELIKDFNEFESLYRDQQDLVQQAAAYNRAGEMSREDQLAMKDLAANEKQVADALDQLEGKLRDHATAADKNFPKAAQSGRDLADQITQQGMQQLAGMATDQMLAGAGSQSFDLADRLRGEMERLFGVAGGSGPSSGELDTYLRLQRMNPGSNFAQMARSRNFGFGKGRGEGSGEGQGMMGTSGYAVMDGSTVDVMGNESFVHNSTTTSRQSSRNGKGAGALAAGERGQIATPDEIKGLNPVNRQSGADSSETVIQEYNDLVDSYFKAITTKKAKPSNE